MFKLQNKKWKIENVETIIFDKDGTFVDLHFFWGQMTKLRAKKIIKYFNLDENHFSKICFYLGFDITNEKMLKDGITALYSRSKIIKILTENLKELSVFTTCQTIEKIFDEVSEIFYKEIHTHTKLIKSAVDFIKKAHEKGLKLGIVTSDSIVSTKMTLEHFNLNKYFEYAIGREDSIHTKESGIPTKIILDKMNTNNKTTVMIGDAPMDFISAKNAGIERTILVSTGQIETDELLNYSKYCAKNLDEIEIIEE